MRWPKSRQWSLARQVMSEQVEIFNGDKSAVADLKLLLKRRPVLRQKKEWRLRHHKLAGLFAQAVAQSLEMCENVRSLLHKRQARRRTRVARS